MADLIRYTASIFAGLLSSTALFLLSSFPIWWVFCIILFVWLVFLFLLHHVARRNCEGKKVELALVFVTALSFVSLLSLLEWTIVKWLLMALQGLIVFFLLGRAPEPQVPLISLQKPVRRTMMMIWVFDTFALLSFLFALNIFFPDIPFWILNIIGGLIIAIVSLLVWRVYFDIFDKRILLWVIILSFAMMEVIWTMHLLPLGFFVLGAFATWLWYIVQLLIRFHLKNEGVVWKKQGWFLGINIALWIVLLAFAVRWI